MSLDIGHILNDWPYEPGQVTARRIRGADGREKIQLRLDLGLLQMEITGRPDGHRPHGFETMLDYYESQFQRYKEQEGREEGFELDEQACELLRAESLMFYHRYLAEFDLEDFAAVERELCEPAADGLLRAHAADESDRMMLEQYRPYVLMMCVRARAHGDLWRTAPSSPWPRSRAASKKSPPSTAGSGRRKWPPRAARSPSSAPWSRKSRARSPSTPSSACERTWPGRSRKSDTRRPPSLRDQLNKAQHPEENAP